MRYIDRTGKKRNEKGANYEIKAMGALTREATKKAEANGLAVMKTSWGPYRVIRKSGLGSVEYPQALGTLEEVDQLLKSLD